MAQTALGKTLFPQESETPEVRFISWSNHYTLTLLQTTVAGQLDVSVGNAINFDVQGDKGRTEVPMDAVAWLLIPLAMLA